MTVAFRQISVSRIDAPKDIAPGPAAILQWLDVNLLVIDDHYQRELKPGNWKAIRKIAAGFRWSMFSPVFVSPVEGGFYAIIDGQHRTHAAAICGFSQVPCQIVHMSRAEQAAAFAAVNGTVTQVTAHQVLKAALAANEPWAVNAAAIATEGGARLMPFNRSSDAKRPGEIYGIKGFLDVIERRPRAAVVAALKALTTADGYRDNREIWESWALQPLLMALAERPEALQRSGFVGALESFDFWKLVERDATARTAARRSGQTHPPKSETLRTALIAWIDAATTDQASAQAAPTAHLPVARSATPEDRKAMMREAARKERERQERERDEANRRRAERGIR
ncbi:DUF6551 family protein [Rhizobium sp. L51/94]|uniref:DUF6551 family protein n=1 Tax=Rhizobium sp. L51/94 TaxID=2819999 RepID=UPI001C5AF8DE|nr:DUF6551 family protein [Rhizobium sp. L51/94]QXZ79634.1 ParB N-terminal domain-containing protein [Rhizobium sp. L51/94]